MQSQDALYIVLISVHGLIRSHDLELGRDADTGGQTKYVVELAKALGQQAHIAQVDLFTRHIQDPQVSQDYSQWIEPLSAKARIIRVECGEPGYLHKEALWDGLDSFADNMLSFLKQQEKLPDLIHSHYADAGYVGTRLASQLGIPLVFTGHSLGRSKRRRLLASGVKREDIEQRYNMSKRINAEETTLGIAERVITSTHQEIEEQYGLYNHYQPKQMRVIAPGTDLSHFFPSQKDENQTTIAQEIQRFLAQPDKPIILALSRPDKRKNIPTLIEAYGESETLQSLANLVIIAGNREDIKDMDTGAQEVLTDILLTIDQYDLYGKVAYPKHHKPEDVSIIYRLAALSQGVFINPALTEPFGLTLIEAAACGLPIIATEDGGPQDIIKNCQNGQLIDPLDKNSITKAILQILEDQTLWQQYAENGIQGVRQHYSWQAHVDKYLKVIQPLIDKTEPLERIEVKHRLRIYHDKAIVSDLDQNLLADPQALNQFNQIIRENRQCIAFGIATGRRFDSALQALKHSQIPFPDVLITSQGAEIHYLPHKTQDTAWREHIDYLWKPRKIREVLTDIPGLSLQAKTEQNAFKIGYIIDTNKAPNIHEINDILHKNQLSANVIFSFGKFLSIVPVRASKGLALRWFAEQWDIPLEHILAAGGSGADEDMMRGNTLAVVVANRHHEELSELTDSQSIYFAKQPYAYGIIEAIEYYDFLSTCKSPKI